VGSHGWGPLGVRPNVREEWARLDHGSVEPAQGAVADLGRLVCGVEDGRGGVEGLGVCLRSVGGSVPVVPAIGGHSAPCQVNSRRG
jgi:hypothetical protein